MINNIKKIIPIFLLIFIFSLIAGILGYSSVQITTFEECTNSWLARNTVVYDYVDGQHESPEEECTLWIGKSFVKKQNLFNFGNNQVEEYITNYLLAQEYFSWKTTTDSRNFCVIENLNPTKDGLFPLYVWVRCGEFILQNGKLTELSGTSVPAKINYPNQLSSYDLSKFSHEVPGDGLLYSKDIMTIFPSNVQKMIFDFDIINLNKKIESVALNDLK